MYAESNSVYSCEKSTSPLLAGVPAKGTHKVRYQGDSDWDFILDGPEAPIDLSLTLPHYRARYQPVDHRLSMFIGSDSEPIKLKVCRPISRTRFYLEVQADTSDVTVWLPSDFKGRVHHTGKAVYSAGFINRILQNARLNESVQECDAEDEVVVMTRGQVTFRMWDVQTGTPENGTKENLRRIFGCSRKVPETTIDWDTLLRE